MPNLLKTRARDWKEKRQAKKERKEEDNENLIRKRFCRKGERNSYWCQRYQSLIW